MSDEDEILSDNGFDDGDVNVTSDEEEDEENYDAGADLDFVPSKVTAPTLLRDIRRANQDLRYVEEKLGREAVWLDGDFVHVNVLLDSIQENVRKLWDLADCSHISVRFKVCLERFRRRDGGLVPPVTAVPMDYFSDLRTRSVSEHLASIAKAFAEENFLTDVENPEESFFLAAYLRLVDRLPNLTDFCVVCDQPHLGGGRLLPSICRRDFCNFQYEELGLFDDVLNLGVSAYVLELLLALFAAANNSHRRDTIFIPCPKLKIKEGSGEILSVPAAARAPSRNFKGPIDLSKLEELTEKQQLNMLYSSMPCSRLLTRDAEFFKEYTQQSPLAAKLIRWVLSSCGAYLQYIPTAQQLTSMGSEHQFLIIADSPAKHDRFMQLRTQNGGKSRFLFHGSPLENWHSIIRHGLWVNSGTKLQINGAAYGNGIYMSDKLGTSLGYASYSGGVRRHMDVPQENSGDCSGDKCKKECCADQPPLTSRPNMVVAICEVVDMGGKLKNHGGSIFTLNDPDHCCVRMLLVFSNANRYSQATQWDSGDLAAGDAERIHSLVDAFTKGRLEDRIQNLQS